MALASLDSHLIQTGVPNDKKIIYMKAAKECMAQNYFQYKSNYYKIEHGTSMGNSLSPLIAEAYMAFFEKNLIMNDLMPKFWVRYVDDVFAVVKANEAIFLLNVLNQQHANINFTMEKEKEGKLIFLDLQLENKNKKIEISVNHKETATMRFITNDSHTPTQYKVAAFHSMTYRLCRLPLSLENYRKEVEWIKEAAKANGYKTSIIEKMITRHSKNIFRSSLTSFYSQNRSINRSEDLHRVCLSFVPLLTNRLKSVFKKHKMQIVYSNKNKLKNLLGTTKDKIDDLNKSGIYRIECGDCKMKYYGQTKRNLSKRVKEHMDCIKRNQPNNSAVADHVLSNNHFNISAANLKLMKNVFDEKKLDAYESFFISKDPNPINLDKGKIISNLFSKV